MKKKLYGTAFCGNEASTYAKEHGYLDWAAFSKSFDAVLNNTIMSETTAKGFEWEPVINCVCYYDADGNEVTEDDYYDDPDNIEEYYPDVYQQYIVSGEGAELIQEYGVGGLWYCDGLDIYLWDVSHWGTSWDYVLTDIQLNCGSDAWKEA